jgi:hypothetical protein
LIAHFHRTNTIKTPDHLIYRSRVIVNSIYLSEFAVKLQLNSAKPQRADMDPTDHMDATKQAIEPSNLSELPSSSSTSDLAPNTELFESPKTCPMSELIASRGYTGAAEERAELKQKNDMRLSKRAQLMRTLYLGPSVPGAHAEPSHYLNNNR